MEKIKLLPFLFLLCSCEGKNIHISENNNRREIILNKDEVLEDFETYKGTMYFLVKDTIANKRYVIKKW